MLTNLLNITSFRLQFPKIKLELLALMRQNNLSINNTACDLSKRHN